VEDVEHKILLKPRNKDGQSQAKPRAALQQIIENIAEIARLDCSH
jgi:hypothetical protein